MLHATSQAPNRLSDTDIRCLTLPARLGVQWRRRHGEPTSQLEADDLRDLRGPTPLARLSYGLTLAASMALIAASVFNWVGIERRLERERAAIACVIDELACGPNTAKIPDLGSAPRTTSWPYDGRAQGDE